MGLARFRKASFVYMLLSPALLLQGVHFARRPWRTVGVAALVMAVCALGLLRFRVETDPQRLWVGPTSQAAQEKAAYEVPGPLPDLGHVLSASF